MIVYAHQCNGCKILSRGLPSTWTKIDEATHYCPRPECRDKARAVQMARWPAGPLARWP